MVPPWLAEFGDFPTHDARGNRNMLIAEGNIPGRADAGKISGLKASLGAAKLVVFTRAASGTLERHEI